MISTFEHTTAAILGCYTDRDPHDNAPRQTLLFSFVVLLQCDIVTLRSKVA